MLVDIDGRLLAVLPAVEDGQTIVSLPRKSGHPVWQTKHHPSNEMTSERKRRIRCNFTQDFKDGGVRLILKGTPGKGPADEKRLVAMRDKPRTEEGKALDGLAESSPRSRGGSTAWPPSRLRNLC